MTRRAIQWIRGQAVARISDSNITRGSVTLSMDVEPRSAIDQYVMRPRHAAWTLAARPQHEVALQQERAIQRFRGTAKRRLPGGTRLDCDSVRFSKSRVRARTCALMCRGRVWDPEHHNASGVSHRIQFSPRFLSILPCATGLIVPDFPDCDSFKRLPG